MAILSVVFSIFDHSAVVDFVKKLLLFPFSAKSAGDDGAKTISSGGRFRNSQTPEARFTEDD